jgi:hypothetical protein
MLKDYCPNNSEPKGLKSLAELAECPKNPEGLVELAECPEKPEGLEGLEEYQEGLTKKKFTRINNP